jgi:hypothetical protein
LLVTTYCRNRMRSSIAVSDYENGARLQRAVTP